MPFLLHPWKRTGGLAGAVAAALAWGAACSPTERIRETAEGPTAEELVAFYSPQSIRILPFTKPRSFDDDAVPDGIEVSLRTLDGAGDPVKAYGSFIFELYAYRNAAGDRKGERLRYWSQPIVNLEDQKQFWERVTTTYQFQLTWEAEPLRPQQRYILTASYEAPGGKRLFDEYEFEFRVDRREILDALTGGGS